MEGIRLLSSGVLDSPIDFSVCDSHLVSGNVRESFTRTNFIGIETQQVNFAMGNIYRVLGECELALEYFSRNISKPNEKNDLNRFFISLIKEETHQYWESDSDSSDILSSYYYQLGNYFLIRQDIEAAQHWFSKSLELSTNVEATKELAAIYLSKDDRTSAITIWKDYANHFNDTQEEYWIGILNAAEIEGDNPILPIILENLIPITSDKSRYLIKLAQSHRVLGNEQEAISVLKMAIPLDPENYYLHYLLGLIYFENNDLYAAETYMQYSIELNKEYPFSHYYLANVEWELGNITEALKSIHRSILLRAEIPTTWIDLEIKWLISTGDCALAQRNFSYYQAYFEARIDESTSFLLCD